jgi:hypothetical protein
VRKNQAMDRVAVLAAAGVDLWLHVVRPGHGKVSVAPTAHRRTLRAVA